jgi:hypothetical protein
VYRKDFDDFNELLSFLLGKQRKEDRNKENKTLLRDSIPALKPEETVLK